MCLKTISSKLQLQGSKLLDFSPIFVKFSVLTFFKIISFLDKSRLKLDRLKHYIFIHRPLNFWYAVFLKYQKSRTKFLSCVMVPEY